VKLQSEKVKVWRQGFTLVELLVVIAIISALASILLPALDLVQRKAFFLQGMHDFKQIGCQLNIVANDHKDNYPPSVATQSFGTGAGRGGGRGGWTWHNPRYMVNAGARSPKFGKSMSGYLGAYINNASVFSCPSAPDEFSRLQEMWDAGEDWAGAQVSGNYGFYWNYEGIIQGADGRRKRFKGPRGPASSRKYSKLLAADYLGYGSGSDRPPPNRFASCEGFNGASAQEERPISAPYWVGELHATPEEMPEIRLKAVYTDGHVETYDSQDTVILDVIKDRKTLKTYGQGTWTALGWFFLPEDALH